MVRNRGSERMNEIKRFSVGFKGEDSFYNSVFKGNELSKKVQNQDLLYKTKKGYIVIEEKNKECFCAPPFDGHGLNYSQYKRRTDFCKESKMRCLFYVMEKGKAVCYFQWLDVLARLPKEKQYYSEKSKIIIFPLTEFIKCDVDERKKTFEKIILDYEGELNGTENK